MPTYRPDERANFHLLIELGTLDLNSPWQASPGAALSSYWLELGGQTIWWTDSGAFERHRPPVHGGTHLEFADRSIGKMAPLHDNGKWHSMKSTFLKLQR